MNTVSDLQTKLELLRKKWAGHVPKNPSDPNYWKFRTDRCLAIRIKYLIASGGGPVDSGSMEKPLEGDELTDTAVAIFGGRL